MKLHGNAALSLKKRERLVGRVVEDGWSLTEAAAAAEVSERRAGEWVRRFKAEGDAGLLDRSSAPKRVHNRTPEDRIEAIAALRRLRFTGAQIAEVFRMPETTVSGILTRIGMGKLGRLGLEAAQSYERKRPGSWSTSTSRSWAASRAARAGGCATASSTTTALSPTETAFGAGRSAGNTSTSQSTTRPAWPTSRCSPTSVPRPRSPFSSRRSLLPPPRGQSRARSHG